MFKPTLVRSLSFASILFAAAPCTWADKPPASCTLTDDYPDDDVVLNMAPGSTLSVKGYSCELKRRDDPGASYSAYLLTWQQQSKVVETYFFRDPKREVNAGVVSTSIQKLGTEGLVIDEQSERGGHAFLLWRRGAGDYLHYALDYTGYDESRLNYAFKNGVITIWRTIWIEKQNMDIRFGKPLQIQISKENGFVPVDKSILREYTTTLPSCGPHCPN